MALILPINTFNTFNHHHHKPLSFCNNPNFTCSKLISINPKRPRFHAIVNQSNKRVDPNTTAHDDDEVNNLGVKTALSMLKFYKREISPLMPKSCRYLPTCSEYSMIAYKKYGVIKGSILTAWRLCRCNPLGGSGFDPPRWFDETSPPEE